MTGATVGEITGTETDFTITGMESPEDMGSSQRDMLPADVDGVKVSGCETNRMRGGDPETSGPSASPEGRRRRAEAPSPVPLSKSTCGRGNGEVGPWTIGCTSPSRQTRGAILASSSPAGAAGCSITVALGTEGTGVACLAEETCLPEVPEDTGVLPEATGVTGLPGSGVIGVICLDAGVAVDAVRATPSGVRPSDLCSFVVSRAVGNGSGVSCLLGTASPKLGCAEGIPKLAGSTPAGSGVCLATAV
mmetsp:Transcript_69572/g.123064  ORF Transcript_69572/g.123064 Transcript_69572/m.123064 type:complete len:248 (-) Transcript_69572:1102-1845(-)